MTAKRYLFALLALLGFALAGEFVARRWLARPQSVSFDARFGFLQRPGTRVIQSREGWGEYTADADGFLDAGLPLVPGTVSGVLLGDSFGQGLQVAYGKRFSERAEQRLPGLTLLNAAAGGRSPIHYALFAPRFEAAFRPRFLVLQLNDGDLSELEDARLWNDALEEFHGTGHAAAVGQTPEAGPAGRLRAVLRHSGLLTLLFTRVSLLEQQERTRLTRKLTGSHPDLSDVVARPVTARAAFLADSLIAVVQSVNPHLVLVYVPHLNYFARPPRSAYPERRAFYEALAARHGLPLVDPTDAMLAAFARDHEPLHGFTNTQPAEGHLNERGHAIVGRLLAETIARESRAGGRLAAAAPVPAAGGLRR